jgi:hypothetical protein
MPFAALANRIRPAVRGELPAAGQNASTIGRSPAAAPDPDGDGVRIVRCTAFASDSLLVRVVHFAGDPEGLTAALARDESFTAPAGGRLMRCVQQRVVREAADSDLAAIKYPVRAGCADEIAAVFTDVRPEARPVLRNEQGAANGGILHAVAVFVSGTDMVRVVSFTGDLTDVIRYMANRPGRRDIERRLAPYLGEGALVDGTPDEFADYAGRNLMNPCANPVPLS